MRLQRANRLKQGVISRGFSLVNLHHHAAINPQITTMVSTMQDDKKNAAAYWSANLRLITFCMSVWALVSYGFGILLRPLLSGIAVGGTDLGFWFAQQGALLTFIALIFFYAWRMNKLDKKFGLEE